MNLESRNRGNVKCSFLKSGKNKGNVKYVRSVWVGTFFIYRELLIWYKASDSVPENTEHSKIFYFSRLFLAKTAFFPQKTRPPDEFVKKRSGSTTLFLATFTIKLGKKEFLAKIWATEGAVAIYPYPAGAVGAAFRFFFCIEVSGKRAREK